MGYFGINNDFFVTGVCKSEIVMNFKFKKLQDSKASPNFGQVTSKVKWEWKLNI